MVERNAMQANMIAQAVKVLENLRLDVCRNTKDCENCPLGNFYKTFDNKVCADVKHTADKLMLAYRVVEKL